MSLVRHCLLLACLLAGPAQAQPFSASQSVNGEAATNSIRDFHSRLATDGDAWVVILPVAAPGTSETEIVVVRFVEYYNHERARESIGKVAPDDMHHCRQREILSRRERIKRLALE